ncbi:MAG: type II toxin-antitoxin system VapC family toxin [Thermodesulfobacteriota bacterium]
MTPSFVVDNSIVMSWCFNDETNRYADIVLDSLSQTQALVPAIWPLEVVNVLLVSERNKRLTKADSLRFIELLSQLPILVEPVPLLRIMGDLLALAKATSLSSYDAAYLDLALRKGVPLATLDTRLTKAANLAKIQIYLK